jgi:hypothetical protein
MTGNNQCMRNAKHIECFGNLLHDLIAVAKNAGDCPRATAPATTCENKMVLPLPVGA